MENSFRLWLEGPLVLSIVSVSLLVREEELSGKCLFLLVDVELGQGKVAFFQLGAWIYVCLNGG